MLLRLVALLVMIGLLAGCAETPRNPESAAPIEPTFRAVQIESEAQLWWARALGDVNGDGVVDVIVQNNNGFGGWLGWYEAKENGEAWERHVIAERTPNDTLFAAGDLDAGDIDGDGDIDALAVEHPGEWQNAGAPATLYWYENEMPEWTPHYIGEVPDAVKDVNLADFNGDGKLDLAVATFEESTFTIFRQDDADTWTPVQQFVVENLHEGMDAGDIDGDGDLDIAANGYWLENPGDDLSGEWTVRSIDVRWHNQDGDWSRNATKVALEDIDGDGRAEVFMSHSERTGYPVAWYDTDDPKSGTWTAHIIADELPAAHTLQVFDFDDDGDFDVLSGVNKNRAVNLEIDVWPVVLYLNGGDNATWTPVTLTEEGIYNGQIADLEGDGDYDLFRLPTHDEETFEVLINETTL